MKARFANKKIGVFGGSFNPFHKGHKNFIEYVLKNKIVDFVTLIPVYSAPHKDDSTLESFSNRRDIISHVLSDEENLSEKVHISSIEKWLPVPNYTFQTLKKLEGIYHENPLYLMLGLDSYRTLSSWKKPEFIQRYPMIIATRNKQNEKDESMCEDGRIFLNNPLWNFSSTEIRESLKEYRLQHEQIIRDKLEAAIGKKALEFIIDRRLYQ